MKSYQQLDSKAFDRYFSGIGHARSVALYLKTGQIFLRNLSDKLLELTGHLEADRVRDAVVIAHRLKGSLLTLGGNELAEVFRRIEMELDSSNHLEFLKLVEGQEKAISQFVIELNDYMEHLSSTVEETQRS